MGDAVRNTTVSFFSCTGSAWKDNAREVAKRRAAIQREIEQRQKLARKLQDEKMARAIAQKEERLLKQRKAQQRQMLRAKMVLDRRTQVLAEKEKEKKEAVLAKMHALPSHLTIQPKSRAVYAFGSSTPRELEYLTQLSREQKIYDRKLMSSDCSPTAASGSFSHLTVTSPYDSHNYTPEESMTGSFYTARSELKSRQKCASSRMTQSLMITSKPNKPAKINQTFVNYYSTIQRPVTITKTSPSAVSEVPIRTKRLLQQHVLPMYGQRLRTGQSTPSETKVNALKTKSMPRTVHKSVGLQTNNEVKNESMMEKLPSDPINGTVVILEKDDVKVQDDIVLTEVRNTVDIKGAINLIPDINEIKKLGGKDLMVEVSDEKKRAEIASDTKTSPSASEFVRSDIRNGDVDREEKIILESAPSRIREATAVEDPLLLDLSSKKDDNFINEAKTNTAVTITAVNIIDQKTEMHEEQKKETGIELQGITQISEIRHADIVSVCQASAQNVEKTAKVFVQEESLVINERLSQTGRDRKQNEKIIQKPYEIIEREKENGVSAIEINESLVKEGVKSPPQSNSTLKAHGIEIVAEDLKLAEEKNSLGGKRRVQDELLEKEQREREIRKAKLASIMSRTRGGAPSMTVVPVTLHVENSDIVTQEALKHRTSVPLLNEYSMKNALSHTASSVLQKLATTNPKLLSVLQRNGTSQSLADELSAVDPSMTITLPGQSVESVASYESSSTHRPVAMK